MLRRTAQLSVVVCLALCPLLLSGQANQPQLYVFCVGQAPAQAAGAAATMYFSGIMQGPASSLQSFRSGFTQFLMQRFAYRGSASCSPTNSMANAQTAMNNQATSYRNARWDVVQTGWTAGAASSISNPLSGILGGAQPASNSTPASSQPAASGSTTTGRSPAAAGGSAGGGSSVGGNQNSVSNVIGEIFGTGGTGGAGGAKPAQGQAQGQANANAKPGASATAGGASQSPFSQVSGTLSNVFGNKGGANGASANGPGSNGGGRGGQPGAGNAVVAGNGASGNGAPGQPGGARPGQPAQANGVLGSAQFATTKLDIFGCGRQDMQVACVAELTNQNPKDTLVKSTDVWKDAFIVDDRGDRHLRSNAFFLNIDGEQRPQLDISNGKTAKFILMFDNVSAKVQTIALRSQNGNMDVEGIGLIAPDASSGAAAAPAAQR